MLDRSRSHLLKEILDGKPVEFGLMDRKSKAASRQHRTEKHCRTKKCSCGGSLAIDAPAVANGNDKDDEGIVPDLVKQPVVPCPVTPKPALRRTCLSGFPSWRGSLLRRTILQEGIPQAENVQVGRSSGTAELIPARTPPSSARTRSEI